MSEEIKELKDRIIRIEERNNRVEKDKRWETSRTRIILVCIITYIVAYSYMRISNTQNILFAALVPVIGFYLSSLTIPVAKKLWLKVWKI